MNGKGNVGGVAVKCAGAHLRALEFGLVRLGLIVEDPAGHAQYRCYPVRYSEGGWVLNIGAVCPRKIPLAVVLGLSLWR